jgi:tetraacyldisaccharide 4'-kinase
MDEAAYLRLVRGETPGPLASLMRAGLTLPAAGYRAAVAIRNLGFDRRLRAIHTAEIPVVSIGNITLGGTGKTPAVELVARQLRLRNLRTAILSRGYRATEGLNDEGRLLEENLPDVPHLQGRDRAALARIAVEELDSQALVLDDGFQHRRLARNLDIVLLDALDPFGAGRLFPRGLLREPIASLRRAHLVILTRADLVPTDQVAAIRRTAERHAGPLVWAESRHAPLHLLGGPEAPQPLVTVQHRRVAAFCGIGNPLGFQRTLEALGCNVVAFRALPDHHAYSPADVASLAAWARDAGADLALTTQKDSAKLRLAALGPMPLRAVRIGLQLTSGAELLDQALDRLVATHS